MIPIVFTVTHKASYIITLLSYIDSYIRKMVMMMMMTVLQQMGDSCCCCGVFSSGPLD